MIQPLPKNSASHTHLSRKDRIGRQVELTAANLRDGLVILVRQIARLGGQHRAAETRRRRL
jgi:hypothetical protein